MTDCRITLFGPPVIAVGGEARRGLRSKSIALAAYLAVEDRPMGRDTLATLLWPRSGQSAARQNLRTCLHELIRALRRNAVIIDGDTIRLDLDVVQCDVRDFRRLVETDRDVEEIIRCCPAEFMEGFTLRDCSEYDTWQLATAETLRRQLALVLEMAIESRLARGAPEQALAWCQRLIALDPLEQSSHRLAMRVCAASGRWTAAEKQYRVCCSILKQELDDDPEEETLRLAQAVARRDPSLRSTTGGHLSPVPGEVDRFYGRSRELERIEELLAGGDTRLVTLTGPAGTGKTRLAVRAAHRLEGGYPDGIAFVDLTQTTSAGAVIRLIGAALGLRDQIGGGESPAEVLARHLGGRRMLLILDNFEHVLDAAAQVALLTGRTTFTQIIATSREPLRIRGEVLVHVPPLEVPESSSIAEMVRSPAIQLLVSRARQANQAFTVDAANREGIRSLCVSLDGLPLALELAAPLLRVYTPAELAERLQRPLGYLRSAGGDRPERHHSLERAIDWSYDLLTAEQRRLFAELSIFANGFDLAAVEAICGPEGRGETMDRPFRALVEKSLVRQSHTTFGPRFDLLESTREYAAARLGGEPAIAALRSRHAEHYRRFALQAEAGLWAGSQHRWVTAVGQAQGNLTDALHCFEQTERWAAGLQTVNALAWYWYRSGQYGIGCRWLETFLSRSDSSPSKLRAHALHSKGWLTFLLGDWRAARELYRRSLSMSRGVSDRACECQALSDLGVTERWLGNTSSGWRYALEAVEIARALHDPQLLARALVWAYSTTGGTFVGKSPISELEEAAVLSRQSGNEWMLAHSFNGLGDLFRELGQLGDACAAYRDSLERFESLGDRYMSAWNLEGLARVELKRGSRSGALRRTGEALDLFDGLGDELNVALMLARMAAIGGTDEEAAMTSTLAGAAAAILEQLGSRRLLRAPQVLAGARAAGRYKDVDPVGWLRGRTLTRAAAVAEARRLVARERLDGGG